MPYRVDLIVPGPAETEWIFPKYADAAKFLKSMHFIRLEPVNGDDVWYKQFERSSGKTPMPVIVEIIQVK